ncbi:MAG: protein translocase subunit SecD, partial [Planctomycetota bacterium]
MKQNLGLRFFIIAFVLLFLGYKAFIGVTSDDPDERLQLGIDLRGGSELRYRLDLSAQETAAKKRAVRDQSLEIIQDRIDGYGLKDIVLQAIGEESFTVQLSARTRESVDAIKELIEVLGNLEFRITVEQPDDAPYWKIFSEALKQGGAGVKAARVITPEERTAEDKLSNRHGFGLKWYRLSDRSIKKGSLPGRTRDGWVLCRLDEDNISGSDLINTTHRLPVQSFGEGWVVSFDVRKLARPSMARLTSTPKEYMAIILNDRVDSAPILQSTLNANGQISGGFTEKEARQLAAVLQSGALQQRPELVEETTIAPDLAGNARDRGINSTLIAFLMVLVLMLAYYRTPGLVANLALLLNLLILLGVLTWFDAVLTLPGIAGVILTVGMAVDANILVFERIKEEKAKGRTPAQALETGYDRALVTIIDSNLTTLITAYFLFQIGSGPVRGFGITLAIGILASMFTALLVTRTLMTWFMQKGWMKEVRMPGRFAPPAIPWMAMRRGTGRVSAFAIVAGLTLFALVPEDKNLDLEFTKGSKLVISLRES